MVGRALGRLYVPDRRDAKYPMRLRLKHVPASGRAFRYWRPGSVALDQGLLTNVNGGHGSCVGYAGAGWLQNSPVRSPVTNQTGVDLYNACKQLDGIPDQEGTYDRALMKVLVGLGRVERYLWAATPHEMQRWVLDVGPLLVGTAWHEAMFEVDTAGFVHPEGDVVGGHEYLVRGYSLVRDAYRCVQSWGRGWGQRGSFWVKRADLEHLVFDDGGDACAAEEKVIS